MIKIGITGGVGSGKTVVSTFFESIGIPVYIADEESKRIVREVSDVREKLIERFGTSLYEGSVLNKALFASLIFSDKDNLKDANAIIHPEVFKDFHRWSVIQHKPVVAVEAAILFESGLHAGVDKIITVTAPVELRITRAMNRSKLSREEVMQRISNQLSDDWKIEKADAVICNDGVRALIPQIETILSGMNCR